MLRFAPTAELGLAHCHHWDRVKKLLGRLSRGKSWQGLIEVLMLQVIPRYRVKSDFDVSSYLPISREKVSVRRAMYR